MNPRDEFILSEEDAEWVGQKKSEYLSELIMQLDSGDFGFEEFHQFDQLIQQTISEPDRTFEKKTDLWPVRTYIRTYGHGPIFHQIVVGGLITDRASRDLVFVPILAFVTKKEEVARRWAQGEKIGQNTLN